MSLFALVKIILCGDEAIAEVDEGPETKAAR